MYCKVRHRFLFVKAYSLSPYLCPSQAHNHDDGVFNAEPQKRAHFPLFVGAKRTSRSSGAAGSFKGITYIFHDLLNDISFRDVRLHAYHRRLAGCRNTTANKKSATMEMAS